MMLGQVSLKNRRHICHDCQLQVRLLPYSPDVFQNLEVIVLHGQVLMRLMAKRGLNPFGMPIPRRLGLLRPTGF